MRRSILGSLAALALLSAAAAQTDPPGRVGRLNFIQGAVSFQPAGVDDWVPATLNRPLTTGDHLWVDQDGRAEVHVGATAIRLASRSAFEFLNLDDRTVQIRLAEGMLEVHIRNLDDQQVFEIDTPNLAFSVLRPGVYRIEANPDSRTTTVTVRSGQGEVNSGGQAFPIMPRSQARVTGDRQTNCDISPEPPPDWFDGWADSRDRNEERAEALRYVPRDMTGYEDLDAHGYWQPAADYGPVWYPRVVPMGWAPYRFGHWAWIEPWGWTWVDDAPWGFAPFHYGRWAFIAGRWGWVPGPVAARPVYAPALVAWVGGPRLSLSVSVGGGGGGVAWFPLAPREVYVPAYHASPVYVNRVNNSNTVINNVNITNVTYVNQSAPGAMTAVSRATFVGARPVGREAMTVSPESARQAQVQGIAPVAPNRQSVLGHGVASDSVARPPVAAMNRPVFARTPPPPPAPSFAARERVLQEDPGRPVAPSQLPGQPQAVHPFVRTAQPPDSGFRREPRISPETPRPPRVERANPPEGQALPPRPGREARPADAPPAEPRVRPARPVEAQPAGTRPAEPRVREARPPAEARPREHHPEAAPEVKREQKHEQKREEKKDK